MYYFFYLQIIRKYLFQTQESENKDYLMMQDNEKYEAEKVGEMISAKKRSAKSGNLRNDISQQ